MKKEVWKEQFSDAMTMLPEELLMEDVEKMSGKGKHRLRIVIAAAAFAAAAAVLFFGVRFITTLLKPEEQPLPVSVQSNNCLSAAEYPATAKYQSLNDRRDEELNQKIYEDMMARIESGKKLSRIDQKLYREVIREMIGNATENNPITSPANMYMALALLAECAEGETEQEILNALGVHADSEAVENAEALMLANYIDNGAANSHFANALFLNQGIPCRTGSLKKLSEKLYASVFQGKMGDPEYDSMLHHWLDQETGGFLRGASDSLHMDPANAADLISSVYIRAMWTAPFDASETEEGVFHGKDEENSVPFMHQELETAYFYGEHFAAIALGLGGENEARMWLVLPDEGVSVRSLTEDEEALSILLSDDGTLFRQWEGKNAYARVRLSLPKFDLSAGNDLKAVMQSFGVRKAFLKDEADLSGLFAIEDPVWVSSAENRLRIAIDEEGVTAASYIDLGIAGAAMPEENVDFKLDRPFLFCIQGSSGTPLLVGAVEQL